MPLLAQTPCMSGWPSGIRGTDHAELFAACPESPTARAATMTADVTIRGRILEHILDFIDFCLLNRS